MSAHTAHARNQLTAFISRAVFLDFHPAVCHSEKGVTKFECEVSDA